MRLLLDAHVSPAVARGLNRADIDAIAVRDWQGGNYRTAPDDALLTAAAADSRVLVSYDCRTIPVLLKEWAETGGNHAGVILVDDQTIRPSDIGGLIRALQLLVDRHRGEHWQDRVVFLQTAPS
ncbi:MAG: DUF5615 family PIN-like protein [Chloroflexi bacterium]|nr:DUF5615 family PIN-like protein [Chloroflexota bacterium]